MLSNLIAVGRIILYTQFLNLVIIHEENLNAIWLWWCVRCAR